MTSVVIGSNIVDNFLENKGHTDNAKYINNEHSKHLRNSPIQGRYIDSFDDTSYSSDNKSSDEMEVRTGGTQKTKMHRKNSIITFSNVKRKISSTFNRRTSVNNSPSLHRRNDKSPNRQTEHNESPQLSRTRKTSSSLRQKPTNNDNKPATPKQRRSSASSLSHKKILQKQYGIDSADSSGSEKHMLKLKPKYLDPLKISPSASTPDIQSRNRQNSFRAIKQFNIYLLGSKAVGKTALTVRFLTGRYIHEYRSSPEEVYNRVVKYGDEQASVKVHVIDIETMEDDIELDNDSGIMILYSVINEITYNDAKFMLQHLSETGITGQYPVMFIGSKRDLSRMRQVDRQEAFNFSNKFNCTQFEVSAATDKRVKDSFHALFRQIEVRQLLAKSEENDNKPAILNPPKILRNGILRFGTA